MSLIGALASKPKRNLSSKFSYYKAFMHLAFSAEFNLPSLSLSNLKAMILLTVIPTLYILTRFGTMRRGASAYNGDVGFIKVLGKLTKMVGI